MHVYFARPIDQARLLGNQIALISMAQRTLVETGNTLFLPAEATALAGNGAYTGSDMAGVDAINRFALDRCEALVAYLPSKVATLGVPAEIEQALHTNKPTVILTDRSLMARSVQIMNWRERGAAIVDWTETLSAYWRNKPSILKSLLKQEPEPKAIESLPMVPHSPVFQVKAEPAAKLPSRAYPDDAGFDLAISEPATLMVGEYRLIPTGVRGAVPPGWWGMITGRSSTWKEYRCDVRLAVIDSSYRGELMIGVENRGKSAVPFAAGTRLAQYVLVPTFPGPLVCVDELPEGHRGEAGYGSSGR